MYYEQNVYHRIGSYWHDSIGFIKNHHVNYPGILIFRTGSRVRQENIMTIMEMMQQSAVLTVLGMFVVFAFLWLLIICVNCVAKITHALGLDKDVQPPKEKNPANTSGTIPSEIIAAITAAITEHRKKKGGRHD
jgi:oxaloacetate decarboxylase gamma subunit